jgi:predicted phosphodiesterase
LISKVCTKCGVPKSLDDFNLDAKNSDGHRNYCRDCQRKQDRATRGNIEDMASEDFVFNPDWDIPKEELWGEGKAKQVAPSTGGAWETVVFVSDIHAPYHSSVLLESVLQVINDIQPDRIVINGDVNDFFALSRFNKAEERLDLLQDELNVGKQIRAAIRNAAPNAIMNETLGNHDERLITYPAFNARALSSLEALKPKALLGLDEYEISLYPRCGFLLREDFLVEHGHIIRSQSGATAKARAEQTMISGIMGHTHRLDSFRKVGYRRVSWFEQGCLCGTSPDYVIGETNWQPGFAVGMFSTRTNNYQVDLLPALGQGFYYEGRHYGNTDAEYDLDALVTPSYDFTPDLHQHPTYL